MNSIATLTRKDRADLFRLTAERMRFHPVNIEKDFWVCWVLKQLFTIPAFDGRLTFKGGTSLSKCFNLIQRFSEDIDLAVDFERLGFTGDKDPRQDALSSTQRQRLLDKMLVACREYVAGSFLEKLRIRITEILGDVGWLLEINGDDPNTVEFEYPRTLETKLEYIRPRVVLELGTHAEPIPNEAVSIRPFVAEHYPHVFGEPTCSVTTVVARRTFWEKATILHAEYHRPLDKPLLPRYSRHYADISMMAATPVKDQALHDIALLQSVCIHKNRFYRSGWAKYLEAKPGTFRLLPREERLLELRRDYQGMRVMFFEEAQTFDDILERLANLEHEINV